MLKKPYVFICVSMFLGALFFGLPSNATAKTFEVSGWIPYWRVEKGTDDAREHIDELTTIHPFGFTVKENGTLYDAMKLKDNDWKKLFKLAKKKDVLIIPTVTWAGSESIHKTLSSTKNRKKHIDSILKAVKKGKFDGIDIDYENKESYTKDHFSQFLIELKKGLGEKMLVCTIEPRTPPKDLYKVIPNPLNRANDYKVIATYCDRVQIMSYDQQRADLTLNEKNNGLPYIPLSDNAWFEKVMKYTVEVEGIPKEKLMMGIPTYGHEWEVTVAPDWFKSYKKLWAFNPGYVKEITDVYDVVPSRNSSGEMSLTYFATTSPYTLDKNLKIPKNTPSGEEFGLKALAQANKTGKEIKFNIMWWSDAEAIKTKIQLAKDYGVLGVAIFKIDGGEDQDFWEILERK